jgi:hypothetical protein
LIAVKQIDDLILCCWGFECGGDTTRNVGTADVFGSFRWRADP